MQSKKITQLATELNPALTDLAFIGNSSTGQLKKISWGQLALLVSQNFNLQNVTDNGNSTTNSIIVNGLTLTGMSTGVLKSTGGVISSIGLGTANGVATLGGDGKVPSGQLPSYVDDVLEATNFAALPATGETGKIYITLDNNKVYRWTGSVYVEISSGIATWGAITGTLSNQTDLQTALDGKYSTTNPAGYITGITSTMIKNALGFSPNLAVTTGSTGQLVTSIATSTEVAYLSGVSSNIQTQLDGKAAAFTLGSVSGTPTSVLSITGSGGVVGGSLSFAISKSSATQDGYLSKEDWATFNNKANKLSDSANKAVATGSSSQFVASITTATELAYLSGVSSNVQSQLDSKAPSFVVGAAISSPSSVLNITGSGAFVGGSLTFTINQASSTQSGYLSSTDWIRFNDYATGNYLPMSGGTLTGQLGIDISGNTPLKLWGTEPYMEIIAKGGSNTAGIAIYPTSGYDAAIGNFNGGALNLMAESTAIAKVYKEFNFSRVRVGQGADSGGAISVYGSNSGAGYEGMLVNLNSDGNTHFYARNNNTTFGDIGYFSQNGMFMTYYGAYSDIRLKNVIETNPVSDLDSVDVIKYTLKSNPSIIRYGYSAQQVQALMPDLVSNNVPIDGNEEDGTLSLNYNDIHTLKIAALEKRIKELENKLN